MTSRTSKSIQTVSLITRPGQDQAIALAKEFVDRYPDCDFLAQTGVARAIGCQGLSDEAMCARADVMIVLGGDGTLIYGARLLRGRSIPVLGINMGSLGFMTEIPVEKAFATFELLRQGNALIESRMKLSCRLFRDDQCILDDEVLNDVVINKSALARISDYEVWLDAAYVTTYRADGVIFATPTGSTAYSLSAGGPIVHPSLECVVVAPICPHALTQRPIVVPGDQTLRVVLSNDVSDLYLTIDGLAGQSLRRGDRIEVSCASTQVQLVRNQELDYFAILRQKLRWGERAALAR